MHSAEFVKSYPLDIDPEDIHAGEHSQLMLQGQEWSYRFGRLLHAVLANRTPDTFTKPEDIQTYHDWSAGMIDDLIRLVGHEDEAAHRAMNELNFNMMNHSMRSLWRPIFRGEKGAEAERLHSIRAAELDLGIIGIIFNEARETYAKRFGYEVWFEESSVNSLTPVINGILQEIDSAIVLLTIAKRHPSWIVLPAPLNFERMGKGNNVDFVVVDMGLQNTIGVQVKTHVKPFHRQRADPQRVVFIDGIKDLRSTRKLPTRYDSDAKRAVNWPGMIAVQLIANLPANKNARQVNRNMRWFAKRLAKEVPVDKLGPAVEMVEKRLLVAMNLNA